MDVQRVFPLILSLFPLVPPFWVGLKFYQLVSWTWSISNVLFHPLPNGYENYCSVLSHLVPSTKRTLKNCTMSNYLCEDLIVEIFTRLPPKSLLRFRSLSKSWYSCISSPHFIRMHTSRSPQKLLIRHREFHLEDFCTLHPEDQLPLCATAGYIGITPVEFPSYSRYSDIVGSCNGILCLLDHQTKRISLWNPSLRSKLAIPDSPRRCFAGVQIGFGFDPITDDYKIVSLTNPRHGLSVESSYIYTMKTGAWSVITSPTPPFSYVNPARCFVNGALYWVVHRDNTKSRDADPYYILTFDLSTHVFGKIALPEHRRKTRKLTIIQGSLAVISTEHGESWIWVRRDASWSVVYKSKTNRVGQGATSLLLRSTNGDLLLNSCAYGFQVYSPKTGAQSTLVQFNAAYSLEDIVLCTESLQLLGMATTVE